MGRAQPHVELDKGLGKESVKAKQKTVSVKLLKSWLAMQVLVGLHGRNSDLALSLVPLESKYELEIVWETINFVMEKVSRASLARKSLVL